MVTFLMVVSRGKEGSNIHMRAKVKSLGFKKREYVFHFVVRYNSRSLI